MTETASQDGEDVTRGPPDAERLLDALRDEDSRALVAAATDEPRTAKELADICDLSLSATYRRLERLTGVGLLSEGTRVRAGHRPASEYSRDFDGVIVDVTEDGQLDIGARQAITVGSD